MANPSDLANLTSWLGEDNIELVRQKMVNCLNEDIESVFNEWYITPRENLQELMEEIFDECREEMKRKYKKELKGIMEQEILAVIDKYKVGE